MRKTKTYKLEIFRSINLYNVSTKKKCNNVKIRKG